MQTTRSGNKEIRDKYLTYINKNKLPWSNKYYRDEIKKLERHILP